MIKEGDVTWRSWSDGRDGPIAKQWQVESLPTIYVLDRQGFIRYMSAREKTLDAAIEHLLQESNLDMSQDLIAEGDEWRFLDDGGDQGTAWRAADYDDSRWAAGASPLGYGLGRDATEVRFGEADDKRITTYFRKTFQVDDPAVAKQLIVRLNVDDGAAVYLNGQEAVRLRVPADAEFDTLAFAQAPDHGWSRRYFQIPVEHLQMGANTLAVEVHQAHAFSADLHFELTLSTRRAALERLRDSTSAGIRGDLCRILGELDTLSDAETKALEGMLRDENDLVRTRARVALARHALGPSEDALSPITTPQEANYRKLFSAAEHSISWNIVKSPQRSARQLERGLRCARAASALAPKSAGVINTLAVANYRVGSHQEALSFAQKSVELSEKNPLNVALIAMCQHQLGKTDDAEASMRQLESLVNDKRWRGAPEVLSFHDEARQLVGAGAASP